MSKSNNKSKNGGKREKKTKSASLKDLNPKKGAGKVKGGNGGTRKAGYLH